MDSSEQLKCEECGVVTNITWTCQKCGKEVCIECICGIICITCSKNI